ncbi:hypothetical protein FACS1894170_06750 [Planctomycetales bacterium]|nr:hypothetical protein FACS1894170_06750 [Planctomycetales bacterium]
MSGIKISDTTIRKICSEEGTAIAHWQTLPSAGEVFCKASGDASIWKAVEEVFYRLNEVLDIYHALEHVSQCGKVLFGEGTEAFKKWRAAATLELLSENGSVKFFARLSFLQAEVLLDAKKYESVCALENYLRRHECRLGYYERLCSGRSLGSGQVEGACKNLVGRRLKQTGACWRQWQAEKMTVLCAALYSDQWKYAWKPA